MGSVKKLVYHYSDRDYCGPDFNPGTHFGTIRAAHDRWYNLAAPGGCLVEARLDIVRPFETYDHGEWQEPLQFYWMLVRDTEAMGEAVERLGFDWPWDGDTWDKEEAVTSAEFVMKMRGVYGASEAWFLVFDELAAQGYDSITYINDVEDPGSHSYIIFYSDQAVVRAIASLPVRATGQELDGWWGAPPFEPPYWS